MIDDQKRIRDLENVLARLQKGDDMPSGVTDLPGTATTCALHDEVIGNLKDRDSRIERKIDTMSTEIGGVKKDVGQLGLTVTKWGGAFAVLVPLAMLAITVAAKYLLP